MSRIVNGNRIRRSKITKLFQSQDEMTIKDILSGRFTKPTPKIVPKMKAVKPGQRRERIIKLTRVVVYPSLLEMYANAFINIFK